MLNPAQHFNHMQGMHNNVMSAIAEENDSRVAQMREARRQQHEKDLMLMRIQAINQQQSGGMTPSQRAALEVLRMENERGRTGTTKNRALKTLGLR